MGAPLKALFHFRLEKIFTNVEASLAFDSLLGQRILTAHSVFVPDRTWRECAGEQAFVCMIPSLTLFPGEYKVRVALATGDSDGYTDILEDATGLTIIPSDYYGTGKAPWNGLGTFVLRHHWRLM
jgi:hypothetical protein